MIPVQKVLVRYTVTAGVLEYAVPFALYGTGNVNVYWAAAGDTETQTKLAPGTDYSVTVFRDMTGGKVTLADGKVPAGATLAIESAVPLTQELDLSNTATVDTEATEGQLDRMVQMIQQFSEQTGRAVKVPVTSDKTPEQYMSEFWEAVKNVLAAIWEMGKNIGNSTYVTATGSDTPRTLADRFGDVVNVKDFGAVGDGVTDDTEAIQKAVNVGGSIFFPSGKYIATSNIYIKKSCKLFGRDAYIYDRRLPSDEEETCLFTASTKDVSFRLLHFTLEQKSDSTNPYGETCIKFANGSENVAVTECSFTNYVQCVHTSSDNAGLVKNVKIQNNLCIGYDFAFLLDDFDGCIVTGNIGRDAQRTRQNSKEDTTLKPPHLLYVTDRSGEYKRNLIVSNNIEINNKYSSAYKVRHTDGVIVTSNHVDGSERGIEVNDCSNVIVSGNIISLCIQDEDLNDTSQNGIWLYGVDQGTVTNNTVNIPEGSSAFTIRVSKSDESGIEENSNIDISGNIFTFWYTQDVYAYPFNIEYARNIRIHDNYLRNMSASPRKQTMFKFSECSDVYTYANGYADNENSGSYSLIYAQNCTRITAFINAELFQNGVNPYVQFDATNSDCRVLDTGVVPKSRSSSLSPLRFEENELCGMRVYGNNGVAIYAGNKSAIQPNPVSVIRAIVTDSGNARAYLLGADAVCDVTDSFRPNTDNGPSLGSPSLKWSQLYAASGSINTSDANEKQNIEAYPDAVLDAWGEVELRQFLFKDAVKKKGDAARIHSGVIAQQVVQAFKDKGLDATRYGLLCYDEWPDEYEDVEVVDTPAVLDADGNEVTPAQTHNEKVKITEAGSRYGIRYSEALCIEAAYQRRRADRLEERLNSLEDRIATLEDIQRDNSGNPAGMAESTVYTPEVM